MSSAERRELGARERHLVAALERIAEGDTGDPVEFARRALAIEDSPNTPSSKRSDRRRTLKRRLDHITKRMESRSDTFDKSESSALRWILEREASLRRLELAQPARKANGLDQLLAQIRRLRRTPCPTMSFKHDGGAIELIEALKRELAELEAEPLGFKGWWDEALDVVTVALHLLVAVNRAPVGSSLVRQAAKLRRRLDHVDAGGTWAEAKELEAKRSGA